MKRGGVEAVVTTSERLIIWVLKTEHSLQEATNFVSQDHTELSSVVR
jgi:hypothetical protein